MTIVADASALGGFPLPDAGADESTCDASNLQLARRFGIPLLAFDNPLRRAALTAGLEVLPL